MQRLLRIVSNQGSQSTGAALPILQSDDDLLDAYSAAVTAARRGSAHRSSMLKSDKDRMIGSHRHPVRWSCAAAAPASSSRRAALFCRTATWCIGRGG